MHAEIQNFPMQVMDQLISYKFPTLSGLASQLVGDQLNISAKQSGNSLQPSILLQAHSSTLELSASVDMAHKLARISIQSDRIKIPDMQFVWEKKISLKQPAVASFRLPSSLLNHLGSSPFQLKHDLEGALTIHSFSMPSFEEDRFSLNQIEAQATVDLPSLQVRGFSSLPELHLGKLNIDLHAAPLAHPECEVTAVMSPSGESEWFNQAFGKEASIALQTRIDLGNGAPLLERLSLQLSSELLQAAVEGNSLDDGLLFLLAPSVISYKIPPAVLQAAGINMDLYHIEQQQPVKLTMAPLQIPLRNLSEMRLSTMHLSGELLLKDLSVSLKKVETAVPLTLHDFTGRWVLDGHTDKLLIDFQGMTRLGNNQAEGKISGVLSIEHLFNKGAFSLEHSSIKGQVKTHKLPVELLGSLTEKENLSHLFGTGIDATLGFEGISLKKPLQRGNIHLNIETERLYGRAHLLLDSSVRLAENQPAEFRLHLTPNGYEVLRKMLGQQDSGEFILEGISTAALKITSFNLPLTSLNWQQGILAASIAADVSIDQLTGSDKKKEHKLVLENVHGHFSSSHLSKQIDYQLNGQGVSNLHGTTSWEIAGALHNGFLADGTLNRRDLSVNLDASIRSLPAAQLAHLCCLDRSHAQKMEAIFGPTVDAKIKTRLQQMRGPLSIDMKGSNAHFSMDASLDRTVATLNKDLILEIQVTPELGKHVCKNFSRLPKAFWAQSVLLNLSLAIKVLFFPLHPFSIDTITIPKMSIDLGKVYFSPSSQLAKSISLLISLRERFQVWITPCYLSLKNGAIRLDRTDLLINDRYPLAAWGNVDLVKEKVNMIIGLSGSALSQAFNLSGIPRDYLLQLPLKGPLNNPTIDTAKATARISSLVAQSQGGPHGAVIGTVLDIASGSLAENSVPKPTTDPLPWNDLLKDEQKEKSEESRTAVSPLDDQMKGALEEVGKGAGKFLKKIFK